MTYHNAHAARIESGVVQEVIVIPYCNDDDAEIRAYCNRIGLAGTWIDTSYTGIRRGKFASIDDLYDADLDQFISPATSEEPE